MAKIPKCGRLSIGQLSGQLSGEHYKIVGLYCYCNLIRYIDSSIRIACFWGHSVVFESDWIPWRSTQHWAAKAILQSPWVEGQFITVAEETNESLCGQSRDVVCIDLIHEPALNDCFLYESFISNQFLVSFKDWRKFCREATTTQKSAVITSLHRATQTLLDLSGKTGTLLANNGVRFSFLNGKKTVVTR